jgi:hypothetical protein
MLCYKSDATSRKANRKQVITEKAFHPKNTASCDENVS